jgi:excisionase family DNA binding protein
VDELITSAEAARLVGVGPTAVKRWADSGSLPCIRTAGGHRRFRRADVERLVRGLASADREWDRWIAALVSDGSVAIVQARLFEERAARGSWLGVGQALGDLLSEIGHRWAAGALQVIEEHVASSALQRALQAVTETLPVPPAAPRCLLATAEGEEHTLGLSLVELCLREAGWRAEWAGARTRTSDVADRLARGGLDMVALSAASSADDSGRLARQAAEVGGACRQANVALALGGRGAWPDQPAHGVRFTSLADFQAVARTIAARPVVRS